MLCGFQSSLVISCLPDLVGGSSFPVMYIHRVSYSPNISQWGWLFSRFSWSDFLRRARASNPLRTFSVIVLLVPFALSLCLFGCRLIRFLPNELEQLSNNYIVVSCASPAAASFESASRSQMAGPLQFADWMQQCHSSMQDCASCQITEWMSGMDREGFIQSSWIFVSFEMSTLEHQSATLSISVLVRLRAKEQDIAAIGISF